MKLESIAVFCGANAGNHQAFEAAAVELGNALVERDIRMVYGGGSVGLMGIIADTMLEKKGKVKGIITTQLNDLEVGHAQVVDMHIVGEMTERKMQLIRDTDGVITMAGGYGSMDELFEVLCLAQLHLYEKPIGLLNTMGYYTPIVAQLDNMVKFGFLKAQNRDLCIIESDMSVLLERMEAYTYKADPKWV